jgi:hypothetical protein
MITRYLRPQLTFVKTVAFIAGLTLSGAAHAQSQADPEMAGYCRTAPCIYDSRGTLVGTAQLLNDFFRRVNGVWYQGQWSNLGIFPNVLLEFTQPNCVGTAYMISGYPQPDGSMKLTKPTAMGWDGQSFWAPRGTQQIINVASNEYNGICAEGAWGPGAVVAAPATFIEMPHFYTPNPAIQSTWFGVR